MTPFCLPIGSDGLRADSVTPDQTSNLCRMQAEGVTLANHVTVYPSETRVAFPSFATGTTADRHGMIGNRYLDRSVAPLRMIDTSDARLLEQIDAETDGRLVTAETLGELLTEHGKSLAVLASSSSDATGSLNHNSRLVGQFCFSGQCEDVATPDHRRQLGDQDKRRLRPALWHHRYRAHHA